MGASSPGVGKGIVPAYEHFSTAASNFEGRKLALKSCTF